MAHFCFGDNKRLGRALPQHKLMQNLLLSDCRMKKQAKITTGTQTDCRLDNVKNCCCGQIQTQEKQNRENGHRQRRQEKPNDQKRNQDNCNRNFVKSSVKKLNEEVEKRKLNQQYQDLLASIRERVLLKKTDSKDSCCCSCSDTWSDNSAGDGDIIYFPKETRNAMSTLLSEERHRRPPMKPTTKPAKSCAWPGVAERMDHDEEKRLINADEIVAKITSKLSKNKLDIN
ncbi:hypothetical protein Zmor_023326 [Zophobas morio]|uniref:Uncharacterized protein n=2 Tax=Zophobas morio TaxID=2755281 RepID=A0AA38HWV3_9CUCU|nr:hypothetical protein Zmor_023326 [Zophobas morio]